jgi:hypothetical protein
MYSYFKQDNSTAHTESFSVTALEDVFSNWLLTPKLWPPRYPYLKHHDYYLWMTLKHRVYEKTLHSL